MNKSIKICPDCERENPSKLKKCKYCQAVLSYGRDYYKFKSWLLHFAFLGALFSLIISLLSSYDIIEFDFFDRIPNWLFWTLTGFIGFCFLCRFLYSLADVDETFNE